MDSTDADDEEEPDDEEDDAMEDPEEGLHEDPAENLDNDLGHQESVNEVHVQFRIVLVVKSCQ